MISDKTYQVEPDECFTVKLPEGEIMDALNVPDNEGLSSVRKLNCMVTFENI